MTYAPVSCFRSTAGSSSTLSRRNVVRLGAVAAAAGFMTRTGHAAARQAASPSVPEPFEGDTFVGVTSDPELFVALVIGAEEARAYLCDGTSLVVWFTGAAGDTLHLTTINGSTMTATHIADHMSGEATLSDGRTITFKATPAAGIAGLYEIVIAGGRVMGAAAGDRHFDGIVAGSLPDGALLLAGAVSLPESGLRPFAVFSTPDAAGEQRWIVLDDGRVTGAAITGRGSGFIEPTTDLARPAEERYGYIDPITDI